jgi:hypothetical protein
MCARCKQGSLLDKTNKYFHFNKKDTGYHKAHALLSLDLLKLCSTAEQTPALVYIRMTTFTFPFFAIKTDDVSSSAGALPNTVHHSAFMTVVTKDCTFNWQRQNYSWTRLLQTTKSRRNVVSIVSLLNGIPPCGEGSWG